MRKFLLSVAIIATSALAYNASASTNVTETTENLNAENLVVESPATETTALPDNQESNGCWRCGTKIWYIHGITVTEPIMCCD